MQVVCIDCGACGAGDRPPYNCHKCQGQATMVPKTLLNDEGAINFGRDYTGYVQGQIVEVWDADAFLFRVPLAALAHPYGSRTAQIMAELYDLGIEAGRASGAFDKAAEIRKALGV